MSESSHTAALNSPESSSANSSLVSRDGIAGLIARAFVLTLALGVATGGLLLLRSSQLAFVDCENSVLLGIAFVVWVAMILGIVFSEYPRGDWAVMMRVGLATFCRTGFPLLVILLTVNYATRLNSLAVFIGILYAVGLVLSLVLEVSRLGTPVKLSRQVG